MCNYAAFRRKAALKEACRKPQPSLGGKSRIMDVLRLKYLMRQEEMQWWAAALRVDGET